MKEIQINLSHFNKLARLSRQMALSENLLHLHPLVKDKMMILQPLIHYFRSQMQWTMAGPTARLLITFKAALQGEEKKKSQTGFIGPHLEQLQQFISELIHVSLNTSEKRLSSLLTTFTQMVTLIAVYLSSHLSEQGRILFSKENPAAVKRAKLLLNELGLTFVLGSKLTHSAFKALCEGLQLKGDSQKRVTDIGTFYLAILLLLTFEYEANDNDLIKILQRTMKPSLDSMEEALRQAENPVTAFSQFESMRQALDAEDTENLMHAISTMLETFDISHEKVKEDLKQLSEFCTQLYKQFNNIFYRTERTATTIQAA